MKIVYLTAGAAGMYCGSCMHDNSLARAFIQRGVDCLLVPVYTPIRTDEADASVDRVFLGGVNIFLQQKMPWLAYLPRWMDSALSRPSFIRRVTSGVNKTDPKFLGTLTVSMLHGMDGNQRKEISRLCDWLESDTQPDILVLTNMLIGGCIPEFKRRSKRPVYVTLQGDDIFFDYLPEPFREQSLVAMRRLVPSVDGFIVHSHDYGRRMSEILRIPEDRMHVIPLGIDVTDFQQPIPQTKQHTPTIGYLARIAPEKGLHLLVDAFIDLATKPGMKEVRLLIAGWMGSQQQDYWTEQHNKLNAAGLGKRCKYLGSVDRQGKLDFLRQIDLMCVPTIYQEPKGLSVLEAVAWGIPYVQPAHGAFPEMHQRLAHGRLFPAFDEEALCQALMLSLGSIEEGRLSETQRQRLLSEIDVLTMADRTLKLFEPAHRHAH